MNENIENLSRSSKDPIKFGGPHPLFIVNIGHWRIWKDFDSAQRPTNLMHAQCLSAIIIHYPSSSCPGWILEIFQGAQKILLNFPCHPKKLMHSQCLSAIIIQYSSPSCHGWYWKPLLPENSFQCKDPLCHEWKYWQHFKELKRSY